MSDKIRKYVLPNLPYLFVFWFFSKIGTAYRIAPGTDFGTKLMGMLDTFPKAFETYWPGLGGIDLLVGLAGAAGVYLLIQSKIRQAKKFRRDAEYGTARFGTKEDIKPFVDPKFQNNVILTGTEFLTMNTRPKIPANARNLNACVIGSSGSGKTRFWLTPQLLQAHSSYVVVDPKGGTLDQCGRFLQREKYRVRVFNSIDFSKSMHYNPLAYIKTESDVLKFVTALIANTKGDGKEGDEFWTKAETLLYCALVAYIVFEGPEEERNMNTLVEMINSMEVREDDETFKNAVDYMFDGLERRSPQHFAVRQYKKYKLGQNDFLRAAADAVHAAYPFHLIGSFECFGHAFLLHHCRNDDFHALVAGLVDLGKVPMQRSVCEQVCVENRAMFFQIAAAHMSILANLVFRFLWQRKVWNEIIALLTVSATHLLKYRFHINQLLFVLISSGYKTFLTPFLQLLFHSPQMSRSHMY